MWKQEHHDAQDAAREKIYLALKECGVDVGYLLVDYDEADPTKPVGFTCEYSDDMDFEKLSRVSVRFKTRSIDLGCDCGTSSDHCHYRELHVKGISP